MACDKNARRSPGPRLVSSNETGLKQGYWAGDENLRRKMSKTSRKTGPMVKKPKRREEIQLLSPTATEITRDGIGTSPQKRR